MDEGLTLSALEPAGAPRARTFQKYMPNANSPSEIHCDVSSGPLNRLPCSCTRKNSTMNLAVE